MAEFEDSVFSNEEDAILLNMVRAYNIKNIKNRFELSQVWDYLTDAYNKTTTQNYTKKQLRKRTSNIDYKLKKLEEKHKSDTSSKSTDSKTVHLVLRYNPEKVQASTSDLSWLVLILWVQA